MTWVFEKLHPKGEDIPGFFRNIVILSRILQILAHLDREVGPTNMVICWTFRRGSLLGSTFLPFRVLPGHLDFYWSWHHSPRSSIKTLGQKFQIFQIFPLKMMLFNGKDNTSPPTIQDRSSGNWDRHYKLVSLATDITSRF